MFNMTADKITDIDTELSVLIYIKDITLPLNNSPLLLSY